MRPARRAGRRPRSPTASPRPAPKARRARRGSREIVRNDRHAHRRAVEPRRRRSAAQDVAHRQRRVRRAGPAGRPHLRGLAFRQHDRRAPVARQGARHRLRRARLGRQRGRSFDRRDLRRDARRSRHRRLRAVPRNHAQGRGAARLRARGGRARQAGPRLQARPLGGGARACGVAHRRARRRGRRRRHVPRRMRHRARRYARRPDRGLAAAGARAGRARAARAAARRAWSPPPPAAPPWWSIRWRCAASRSSRRRRRRWRASRRPPASRSTPARHRSISRSPARVRGDEGRARRADHRAGVRPGRGRWSAPRRGSIPISRSSRSSTAPARAKPIAAFLVPEAPDALARLAAAGVPNFHTPEACADAVAAALQRRAPRPIEVRRDAAPAAAAGCSTSSKPMRCSTALGVPHAPSVALDANVAAARPPCRFAYPVAVKALSADDRAQVRRRRRGARTSATTTRCSPPSRRSRQRNAQAGSRAGAADDAGPRRSADRLSRRSPMSARW